jgi:type IV secretory pathway VirB4 component
MAVIEPVSKTDPRGTPIMASTQDYLEIADIINDLLITKNGTVCLILRTSSVNFDLLSEEEQDLKIQSFASLVNSLDFQMQILIETRKVNISSYAEYLDQLDTPDLTVGLKRQFTIYKQFIRNLITKKDILDKRFMLVIPHRTATPMSIHTPLDQKQKLLEGAVNYLYPKKYHVIKMLKGMGLDGEQMTSKEIVKYFFTVFNHDQDINIEGLTLRP